MHRSGTSLTAELCHNLGWQVTGPEDFLRQGNQYNPQGYWETSDLVTINRRILYALGGDWHVIPRLRPNWTEAAALKALRNSARKFIAQIPSPKATWKDPRLTLTLEFWQPLVPSTRYIVCLRNPLDVALSLHRRNNMATQWALTLWMFYTSQALTKTEGLNRLPVFYEDLIGPNGTQQTQRLQNFLDTDSFEVSDRVIRSDLSHGHSGLIPLPDNISIPQPVKEMWQGLLDWRESGYEEDSAIMSLAQSYQPPRTQWTTARKYRLSFWMRYVKMQLLEGR
jgi:hypothetical protein